MKHRKDIVRDGYNAISRDYLATRTQHSPDVQLLDELIARLPQGARVLDAGCGAGLPITHLLSQQFDVVGIDFAEAQISLARENVPGVEFVCADLTELSLPESSFDGICSYYAIIHIPRETHRALLDNFYRILKPSGLALLCLGADDLEGDHVDDYLGAPMFWSHFDAKTNLDMLAECGFEVIWSRIVEDSTSPGAGHLFTLVRK